MTRLLHARLGGFLAAAFGVLFLAACEDPSAVGLTILDPGETDPRARVFPAEATLDSLTDATGFSVPAGATLNARALAGRVEDPLFGTVTAIGYLDFGRPLSLPSTYFNAPIERVILRLRPDYRYGESEATTAFDLFEVQADWNASTLASDTTLAVRDRRLASFEVAPGDSLVHVELPSDWVAERDSVFRATIFDSGFHGFQVRPREDSRAALGFSGTSSLLALADRGEVEPDTVAFSATQVFTYAERDVVGAAPPPNLFPLQDGTGIGLHLEFGLDTLTVAPAVTAAFVRLEADTSLVTGTAGFVRPMARTLTLYGLSDNAPPIAVGQAVLDPGTQTYVFSSRALSDEFQRIVLGRGQFTGFAVGFPSSPSTLDVAPIVTSEEAPPRLVLLVVPADN